jgi:cyclic pyranopterin phosphate synthase
VRKVRLTGGEPLLRPNVSELIGELTALDGVQDVALTSNGVLLAQHAAELKANGLHRITVSLDTLDPAIFAQMSGGFAELSRVLEGLEAAVAAGLTPIKINCVVERGLNDHTVLDLLERFRGTSIIVRLIEYMDVGNRNHWSMDRVVPSRELVERIGSRWPVRPVQENYRGEVADRYVFEDGQGEIGFISSVTNPFCGDCTRARLSSEGVFYTCLFATSGVDLRRPLRDGASDEELLNLIQDTWTRRSDRYSEQRGSPSANEHPLRKIEMYYIGG